MQIVGEAGWQPCTCARQCMSPSRCQRERFGSFPVSIIVWFNCWLYAKRKYLLIILQKERSPAGRGAGVRRPGISRHDQQTCQPTCHTPTPAAATVIVTERDPEFTSSLTDLRRGAQAPYILYACAILLSGVAQWSVFCFCPWNNPRDLHWRPHLSLGLACVCIKRDGSSASWESRWHPTVFNKGWTLSLSWHCSRTSDSDGRGDKEPPPGQGGPVFIQSEQWPAGRGRAQACIWRGLSPGHHCPCHTCYEHQLPWKQEGLCTAWRETLPAWVWSPETGVMTCVISGRPLSSESWVLIFKAMMRGSPGSPGVENLPFNVEDTGSTPGWGTKMPHASGQWSWCTATAEPGAANCGAHGF